MCIYAYMQTILMKHHTLFFPKLGKMSQNLSSAAVVIGALRVKCVYICTLGNKVLTLLSPKWFYSFIYYQCFTDRLNECTFEV